MFLAVIFRKVIFADFKLMDFLVALLAKTSSKIMILIFLLIILHHFKS